jgi:hypothetical protein
MNRTFTMAFRGLALAVLAACSAPGDGDSSGGADFAADEQELAANPCANASLGNGGYCGAGIAGDPSTLYQCVDRRVASSTRCAAGCEAMPAGQNDRCGGGAGNKRIVVDVSEQRLRAYEGGNVVYDAPIGTGKDGFNTPIADFTIRWKLPSKDMQREGPDGWFVPDVPWVMNLNANGVAIHGAYWNNDCAHCGTGTRLSHGCVNMKVAQAKWLYGWAPVGTPVHIQK